MPTADAPDPIDTAHTELNKLTLSDLARIQRTLHRRAVQRDGENQIAIGFGPKVVGGVRYPGITARFFVRRKKARVPVQRGVPEMESIRLLRADGKRYRVLSLRTDVIESRPGQAVGVEVRNGDGRHRRTCTTAIILRWSTIHPTPPEPEENSWDDLRWRWGVMTVSHGIGRSTQRRDSRTPIARAAIERLVHCGQSPRTISGRVVAQGRLPGDPDCAVLETGADRLWLSGLLPRPEAALLAEVSQADVLRWVTHGSYGYLHSLHRTGQWEMETYFPERSIDGLGRLQHVLQFSQRGNLLGERPFAPGTSGAVLVEGGIPVAMQVAATRPDFTTGFAQASIAILPWLRRVLGASSLGVVSVL